MINDNVKSVARVFEILECFERERRLLNATKIAQALNYPQSSTQALLKTMVNLGYLTYDSRVRGYFPTPKVLLKNKWLENSTHTGLLDAMDDLQRMTGETVTLCSYCDMDMQVVEVVSASQPVALHLTPGSRIPLFSSAVGIAFLAHQTDELVDRFIRRAEKLAARDLGPTIERARIKDALNLVRARGAAVGYSLVLEGVGAISAAIRCPISGTPFVLSVGGPDARIATQESNIVKAVRDVIRGQYAIADSSALADSHGHPPGRFLDSMVRPGLERITRSFEAFFDDELRDAGISSKESRVIGLLLTRQVLDAEQLANLTLISGSSLDETLGSLTTKGLITKNQAHYSLTARGRALASALSEKLHSFKANALGPIAAPEAEELQRLLDRLSGWIGDASSAEAR